MNTVLPKLPTGLLAMALSIASLACLLTGSAAETNNAFAYLADRFEHNMGILTRDLRPKPA